MIEEINKLQDIIDKGRSIGTIDDGIGKELLKMSIEILDKYNNQEPKATIFIDTEDMEERYGTQLYIEYLERHKKAWEELKEMLEDELVHITFEDTQNLEKKHGILDF